MAVGYSPHALPRNSCCCPCLLLAAGLLAGQGLPHSAPSPSPLEGGRGSSSCRGNSPSALVGRAHPGWLAGSSAARDGLKTAARSFSLPTSIIHGRYLQAARRGGLVGVRRLLRRVLRCGCLHLGVLPSPRSKYGSERDKYGGSHSKMKLKHSSNNNRSAYYKQSAM